MSECSVCGRFLLDRDLGATCKECGGFQKIPPQKTDSGKSDHETKKSEASSVHDLACEVIVWKCQRAGFDARRTGFVKELKKLAREDEADGEEFIDICNKRGLFKFVPDAYLIDRTNRLVEVWEVEDSNCLPLSKIYLYIGLYWAIDILGYFLNVRISDRYGIQEKQLNLMELNVASLRIMERYNGKS